MKGEGGTLGERVGARVDTDQQPIFARLCTKHECASQPSLCEPAHLRPNGPSLEVEGGVARPRRFRRRGQGRSKIVERESGREARVGEGRCAEKGKGVVGQTGLESKGLLTTESLELRTKQT